MITRKGFSLVELMIVVAIIGILVAALLPQLNSMIAKAKESNAKQSMKSLSDSITRFNATEPRECQDLKWLVPNYLKELKNDPWGTPYSLLYQDGVILSYGPDRKANPTNRMDPVNRDNIETYYKPKLGISDAKLTLDIDGNGKLNNGDRITIFFTKAASTYSQGTTTSEPLSPDHFVFTDRYEIDAANEFWLYGNAPQGDAANTNFMWNGFSTSPAYARDLDGGANATFNQLLAVNPTDGSTTAYTLAGDPSLDSAVTFEVDSSDDWELISDLYVRFAIDSVNPNLGIYRDKRGIVAIQNGYNVKVEPYF